MTLSKTKTTKALIVMAIIVLAGAALWRVCHRSPRMVYTSKGYGGYIPEDSLKPDKKKITPLTPAVLAYNTGNYKQAEAEAFRLIKANSGSKDPSRRTMAARARYILAFSAARRKDMALARDRFAVLQHEAAKLPDKGKEAAPPGVVPTTLEQDAAYQHAVCTAAMGDKKAAEAEYMKFMSDYPDSPLLNAAAKRIERLHGGHMPPEAEAAWTKAAEAGRVLMREKRKQESMCGPETLAELMRRNGAKPDVQTLGAEMHTSDQGTSMLALAKIAEKHGFKAKGYQMNVLGLQQQRMPAVVVLSPSHYVIVEKTTDSEATIWDPYGRGVGKPSRRTVLLEALRGAWTGNVLLLQPKQGTRIE